MTMPKNLLQMETFHFRSIIYTCLSVTHKATVEIFISKDPGFITLSIPMFIWFGWGKD